MLVMRCSANYVHFFTKLYNFSKATKLMVLMAMAWFFIYHQGKGYSLQQVLCPGFVRSNG